MHKPQTFDVAFARTLFPVFEQEAGQAIAFFDNAGGTFPCEAAVDRLTRFYRENKVQPFGKNRLAAAAGEQMEAGRSTMADLLGVPKATLTFGPSTTQNINTLALACLGFLAAGDEILVSEQDHEANIGGWQRVADLAGAHLSIWPVNPKDGSLSLETLTNHLTERTKVVALTHSSNIVGTPLPIEAIAQLGHDAGARVVIDGVSFAPHQWPDLSTTEVDAYAFSTYKTYATHLGILYTKPDFLDELTPQCHFFNTEKEGALLDTAGPDHGAIAALAGLGDYFRALHNHHFGPCDKPLHTIAVEMTALMHRHEQGLCEQLLTALQDLPLRVIGPETAAGREANVALFSDRSTSASLCDGLAEKGVAAKHGHFYAYRLMEALGIDPTDGVLRLSFAHYNTMDETMRVCQALQELT